MRIQKVLSEVGPILLSFVLVDEGKEGPNTKSGPSSAHQRNAIHMAFCWRERIFAGGPTLNAGLVAF